MGIPGRVDGRDEPEEPIAKLEEPIAKLEAIAKRIKSNFIKVQSYRDAHNKSSK